MCFHLSLEDLAANAFIELDAQFVPYTQLENYGKAVVQHLKDKGKKAILMLSRDKTNEFLANYSDFFEECINEEGLTGIKLKDGKNAVDLIQQFRGYLDLEVLLAFIDKDVVKVLTIQNDNFAERTENNG